jgi:hypothetical protein
MKKLNKKKDKKRSPRKRSGEKDELDQPNDRVQENIFAHIATLIGILPKERVDSPTSESQPLETGGRLPRQPNAIVDRVHTGFIIYPKNQKRQARKLAFFGFS